MTYEQFRELCGEAWKDEEVIIFILMDSERKVKVNVVCNESKNFFIECVPETNPFLVATYI